MLMFEWVHLCPLPNRISHLDQKQPVFLSYGSDLECYKKHIMTENLVKM